MQEPCLGKVLPALRNSHLQATKKTQDAREKREFTSERSPRGKTKHDAMTLGRPSTGLEKSYQVLLASV
jgi:hypothetical protein